MGKANPPHFRKINRPPQDEGWAWLTAEMLAAPAFRYLTGPALRVLLRLMLEHVQHAGQENGNLPVTYDDLENYGVRRHGICKAIDLLVAMGWVDISQPGVAGKGIGRSPTHFRLTWLPEPDGSRATNRWKTVKDDAQASEIVRRVEDGRVKRPGPRTRVNGKWQAPANYRE